MADINDPDVAVQLTFSGRANRNPRWSPNGSKITFESTRDGNPNGNAEIYVMNADGSAQLRLTDFPGIDSVPSFSPDGHWIVFHRQVIPDPDSPNGSDLFAVPADGSGGIVQLTNKAPASFSSFASWAPGHDVANRAR